MSLEARLETILRRSKPLMHVLEVVRDLDLPDPLLFAGAIYQRVINDLTGRPLDAGIKDYDVAYFDASDVSYEAEDIVIRRAAASFEPPLREMVEVRNQARVHLWFESHFGETYAPVSSSAEAVSRFMSPLHAVAVRLEADDRMTIVAPFGLEDLFALTMRPNPARPNRNYPAVSAKAKARWPELTVLEG